MARARTPARRASATAAREESTGGPWARTAPRAPLLWLSSVISWRMSQRGLPWRRSPRTVAARIWKSWVLAAAMVWAESQASRGLSRATNLSACGAAPSGGTCRARRPLNVMSSSFCSAYTHAKEHRIMTRTFESAARRPDRPIAESHGTPSLPTEALLDLALALNRRLAQKAEAAVSLATGRWSRLSPQERSAALRRGRSARWADTEHSEGIIYPEG